MVFSSLTFLFFFLPLALLLYYISPNKVQNGVLLIISLLFYAWGEPIYVGLIIFSACADYIHGLIISGNINKQRWKAKLALLSSLIVNIGLLSFFKYEGFLIENVNLIFGTEFEVLDLPLPIGVSFYTFQTISYTIDVYRGHVRAQKNPITLMMYVTLFPQLIAGPIVRYHSIEKQLYKRPFCKNQFTDGVVLFVVGLAKKVLIANNIGLLWYKTQSQPIDELSVFAAWLGIIAFAIQLYFDFSGYSDMAIGLGKMFGFDFPQNFNYPYIARNVAEFWRRWHMTLGIWFRDYVYIPLGGSKKGKWKTVLNLFIVWGLTGLWHGASWNFILWGLYFGVFISLEHTGWKQILKDLPKFFQHSYLVMVILCSWVIFVFEDVHDSISYFMIMFGVTSQSLISEQFVYDFYSNAVLLFVAILLSTPFIDNVRKWIKSTQLNKLKRWSMWTDLASVLFYFILLLLSTAYLVDDTFNPFLYFRF